MEKNTIDYKKPEANNLGLIKNNSKVTLTLSTELVGKVGIGFGEDTVRISLEDIDPLINLSACLNNALDKVNLDKPQGIELGQQYTADIFLSNGSRSKYIR